MPDNQPEDMVLHLLRDMRDRIEQIATKDIANLGSELRSEFNTGFANVAADIHELDAKIDTTRKELSEQIVGLRRSVVEYHSAVIGHGTLIADLEARVRRVEQHLGLESH
jgi:hypothetical protein